MARTNTQQTTKPQAQPTNAAPAQGWSNPCVPAPISRGKAQVTLHHAMSPTCWWSWGYYGTLGRVRLVYGDQVDLNLVLFPVYEDVADYWKHYSMDPVKLEAWAKEAQAKMGVPIFTGYARRKMPKTAVPPVLATLAAYRQGQPQGDRFCRALCRRFVVEGSDATTDQEFVAAAEESGLDIARFRRDLADRDGLSHDLHQQQHGLPNVQLGFYNLALQDARGRVVALDDAFEPDDVISAIEYLTDGKLVKNVPTDPVAFLTATGPAPQREIERCFGWTANVATQRLGELEKAGRVRRVRVGATEMWSA